jgi:hypothetical protein
MPKLNEVKFKTNLGLKFPHKVTYSTQNIHAKNYEKQS